MNRILSWTVIVLCAVGIGVVPTVLIDRYPEWLAGRLHRIVGIAAIELVFLAPLLIQMRRLKAMRARR